MSIEYSDFQISREDVNRWVMESQKWNFTWSGREVPNLSCLGFVIHALKEKGQNVPEGLSDDLPSWSKYLREVKVPRSGNIVLLDYGKNLHVGIMYDSYNYVSYKEDGLRTENLPVAMRTKKLLGVYRFEN